jgi:virginiamycin B lyase
MFQKNVLSRDVLLGAMIALLSFSPLFWNQRGYALGVPSYTQYTTPTSGSVPQFVTKGADGAVWFTEYGTNSIGRVSTNGTVTEYPTGVISAYTLTGIVAGPDGNIWFGVKDNAYGKVGKMTPSGAVTFYTIPRALPNPQGYKNSPSGTFTVGSDGNIWFADSYFAGVINPTSGAITQYPVYYPTLAVTAGPDGNMWFTTNGSHVIKTDTVGSFLGDYLLSSSILGIGGYDIKVGSDNNLWIAGGYSGRVFRFTTAGTATPYSVPTSGAVVKGIALGPDGNMWFTEQAGKVGTITTQGAVTEYTAPASASPYGIVTGADNAIWFADSTNNNVTRMWIGY